MKSKQNEIDPVELALAEDEYDLTTMYQNLLIQRQLVQEALESMKAEQDKMKGQLDSMPKRLEETIDSFLKTLPQSQMPQTPIGGGGLMSALPELAKLIGIGGQTPNQAMLFDLQGQFEMMTAQLWKLQLRKMKDQLGIPEHIVSESVHLTGS